MTREIGKARGRRKPKSTQIDLKSDRSAFWKYCERTELAALARSKIKGIPCNVDAHFIDRMLVDQCWRCAVSGILLKAPKGERGKYRKDPFGPSLDRIIPALGYVEGNLRVVCNIVNSAMNEWGLSSLQTLLDAMRAKYPARDPVRVGEVRT